MLLLMHSATFSKFSGDYTQNPLREHTPPRPSAILVLHLTPSLQAPAMPLLLLCEITTGGIPNDHWWGHQRTTGGVPMTTGVVPNGPLAGTPMTTSGGPQWTSGAVPNGLLAMKNLWGLLQQQVFHRPDDLPLIQTTASKL